jgi:hypothetical protein
VEDASSCRCRLRRLVKQREDAEGLDLRAQDVAATAISRPREEHSSRSAVLKVRRLAGGDAALMQCLEDDAPLIA